MRLFTVLLFVDQEHVIKIHFLLSPFLYPNKGSTHMYPDVFDHLLGNALVHNDPKVKWLLRNVPKDAPEYPALLDAILTRRARWRTTITVWQREWQTKVSRRPQRTNHHDSIKIREGYVRC